MVAYRPDALTFRGHPQTHCNRHRRGRPDWTVRPQSQATSYAIDNINVVDVVSGTVLAGQRVVITGSRITALGAERGVAVPPNATRIDGSGKYLIPGMWDMHVHVTDHESPARPVPGERDHRRP